MSALDHCPRRFHCYRWYCTDPWDPELIWSQVQSWGGSLSLRIDHIDYWVPELYSAWFLLQWPLQSQPERDLI